MAHFLKNNRSYPLRTNQRAPRLHRGHQTAGDNLITVEIVTNASTSSSFWRKKKIVD